MGAVTYPTIEHVAMQARPYPAHLLEGCETGLVLFAAAFLGHNDAIHFAEAGLETTCVDVDMMRMREMTHLYEIPGWTLVVDDAWHFAETYAGVGKMWDAVSCDTWTGDLERRSLDSLELWCSLARRLVTATLTVGSLGSFDVPEGWQESLHERASGVYWLVLTRD